MRTHAWWLGKCGHEWAAPINNRAGLKNGCPYCKNKKVLVGTNDLRTINPLLATEWHPILNKINPEDVFSGTKTKVWWLGICGHEWQASVASRQKMKSGCPKCASGKNVSKAEKEIFNYIQSLTTFLVDSSNRTAIRPQELDIYIPEKKLAIEFNGTYWHSAELGRCSQDYHFKKWQLCEQKNIKLIQIWEDDYNVNPSLIKEKIKSLFSPQIVLEDYTTETKDEGKIEFYSSTEIKIASFNFRMEDEVLYTSSPVLSSGYFCVDWVVLLEGYAQENNVKQVSINLDNDWSSDISYLRDKGFEICTVQPPTSRKTQKGYTVFNSGMTILSKFF